MPNHAPAIYTDTGCALAPACLSCPFAECLRHTGKGEPNPYRRERILRAIAKPAPSCCPHCHADRLFVDEAVQGPPDLYCLACGWRDITDVRTPLGE